MFNMNKYNLYSKNSESIEVHGFGMYNSGIICYYNSSLQCLFSCQSFVDYAMTGDYDNDMLSAIKLYLSKMNKSSNSKPSYDLGLFNLFMSKIKNKFKESTLYSEFGYNQEDCCEFITILLDVINDKFVYNLFKHTYKCKLFCLNCRKSKEISDDDGYIFSVNPRIIESNTINSKNVIDSQENSLTRYIRNNYSVCSGAKCPSCNSTSIIKTSQLTSAPSIIIISLDKYDNKYMYNYPGTLEFINKIEHKNKHIFKLVSTIHHNGNKNFGHYYSKCLREDGWFMLNDLSVSNNVSISPESNVYVIAYHYSDTVDYFS